MVEMSSFISCVFLAQLFKFKYKIIFKYFLKFKKIVIRKIQVSHKKRDGDTSGTRAPCHWDTPADSHVGASLVGFVLLHCKLASSAV